MSEVENPEAVADTGAPAENLGPEDERKLFVGGLPQEAKDTDIKEYFGTFGEIDNINLKTDPHTGRSRGFAFVVFKDAASLQAASVDESHVIKVGRFSSVRGDNTAKTDYFRIFIMKFT